VISYSQAALEKCSKNLTLLAEMEDLGAHANSVAMRIKGGKIKS
jgi:histidinol dehydrogenase